MVDRPQVYWVDTSLMSFDNSVAHKLNRLVEESGATRELKQGMRVALKVNTAEEGYEYGLRPVFVRAVADAVRQATETSPVVCDGLKLIDYWRKAKGHSFLDVSRGKGYTNQTVGGNFLINGGYSGDEGNTYPCAVPDSVLGGVEVGTAICRTDALFVLSHITLHPLFGLSGALINGGFECLVGRERARVLDGIDPYPFNGTRPAPEKLMAFSRRAIEGHMAVRAAMEDLVFYINYLWDVTPQPEYFPYSNAPLVPNLGFLASSDPVALDAATYDCIAASTPGAAMEVNPVDEGTGVPFPEVLSAAQALGLGTAGYDLKRLS